MPRYNLFHFLFFALLLTVFSACKKETETNVQPAAEFATAGTNQRDITDFSVKLNADSLKKGQSGKWTIVSGLKESGKVYFDDENKADTRFHGMPGETYVLKWSVSGYSESTVNVSFKPLTATITNSSPDNKTQFFLAATNYDGGQWTIDGGSYAYIRNQSFGGTVTPDINAPYVKFQGYTHRNYKLTWVTHYGSKSASASITLSTGDYLESEALTELELDPNSYRVTTTGGQVTGLDLSSSGIAYILSDTVTNPAVQGLKYLKNLNLAGSSVSIFPTVFGDRYQQLESLNLSSTAINSIASNISQLKKLKELDITGLNYGATIYSLPDSFGQLESLEVLRLGVGLQQIPGSFGQLKNLIYCDITGNLPETIGNCTNLQHLSVINPGGIAASLSKLTKLRFLNWIAGTATNLPADIGNMIALDTIQIQATLTELPVSFASLPVRRIQISGVVGGQNLPVLPDNFGDLPNLEDLTVSGTFSTLPASFGRLIKLKFCTLNTPNLTSLPADIGNLTKLGYLSCSYAKLSAVPASIGNLTALTELRLGQNNITVLPNSFYSLSNIKTIDLGNNKLTGFSSDFQKLKNTLSILYVQGNTYQPADLVQLKNWLPTTAVYPYQ